MDAQKFYEEKCWCHLGNLFLAGSLVKNTFRTLSTNSQSASLDFVLDPSRLIQSEELMALESIRFATEEQLKECIKVAHFVEECLEKIETSEMQLNAVYRDYPKSCENNSCRPENSAKFHRGIN